jgi:cytochrome bd-type quinol oxidase subunit 2
MGPASSFSVVLIYTVAVYWVFRGKVRDQVDYP